MSVATLEISRLRNNYVFTVKGPIGSLTMRKIGAEFEWLTKQLLSTHGGVEFTDTEFTYTFHRPVPGSWVTADSNPQCRAAIIKDLSDDLTTRTRITIRQHLNSHLFLGLAERP